MPRLRKKVKHESDKVSGKKPLEGHKLSHGGIVSKGKGDARMENTIQAVSHKIALTDRGRLEITGVEEVESFDENTIIMSTSKGNLIVRGEGLHIETLSLDGGALKVEGRVESLTYEEPRETGGGLLSRLFR